MNENQQIESIIQEKLSFFDSLGKAVVLVGKDFKIHACNNFFSDIYFSDRSSLTGQSFFPFICPDDWEKCMNQLQQLITGEKEMLKTEKRFKDRSGKFVWANIIAKRWMVSENHDYIFFLFDDVSSLKKTEKLLADSEMKYLSLIENLPVAVFHIDMEEPGVYFSKQFEDIFHINPGDFNDSFFDIRKYIHAEDLVKFNHSHSDFQEGNNLVITEYRLTNDLNETFWVRERAQIIREGKGRITHIYGVMMDLTSEIQTQKQLLQSEIKHRTLIESANDRIGVLDLEGNLIYGNSHFFNCLGIDQQEYFSLQYMEYIHPDDIQKHSDAIREVKEKGNVAYEYRVKHKNGKYLNMYNKLTLFKDENGKAEGIFSINRDITRLKKIEKELIQARQKAEESDRLKSAFLANMSHEIRTPLNGIIGFSKLLSSPDVIDKKRKFYSDIIERNSQQLMSLISDIIDIAKIESDQLRIYHDQVNLNDLLDEIYQIFSNELYNTPDRDVTLRLSKDLERDQSFIFSDRFRLAQLFNNLLNNALKFTSSGSIEFGYRYSGKDFLFYVKDTGIGILPENQVLIFEPFRQENDTMTRKYGGTGLGLAICRKLIHLMGGKIWLDSEKDKGSIFYFNLKIDFSENPLVKLVESSDNQVSWPDKIILVVDDNKDILTYMNEIFSDSGGKIITAESGKEAIEICNWAEKIDLVLMDIQMPGMDGYETTKEILKIRPDIPVIAQTAHAMAGDEKKCLRAGCKGYIAKPIDKQKLIQLISAYL